MEELDISSEKLKKMPQIGRGACSIVYEYRPDLVIKELNEKGLEMYDEEHFSNLIGIENDTCIFPKDRVKIDGKFRAYTMEYVKGTKLSDTIKQIEIPKLQLAIKKAESDLTRLASDKILIKDLNQGSIMWDEHKENIKIIDTDFFEKNENITEQQCYNANINAFYNILEMELGFLNGQGTQLSEYLQSNEEFSKLYKKYMIYSLNGKNMSITELLDKAVEIFEHDYGIKANNIAQIEEVLNEKTKDHTTQEIPTFVPPSIEHNEKNDKLNIKQKILEILKKIPVINKFISKQPKLLPEKMSTNEEIDTVDRHSQFIDRISCNGKYFLGQPVKTIEIEKAKQRNKEPYAMSDKNKIEKMKNEMDEKSLDNDL